jgi:hypothetical protein
MFLIRTTQIGCGSFRRLPRRTFRSWDYPPSVSKVRENGCCGGRTKVATTQVVCGGVGGCMRRVEKGLGLFGQLRYGEVTWRCRLQDLLGVFILMDGNWR